MRPVVVIDDDADVRDVIIFALENDGYKVISYENGKAALDGLTGTKDNILPCMIIVDYLMPEMDGATFIQEIQKKYPDSLGKVPVALTSAMGTLDPVIQESKNLFHIHKPMDLNDLLKLVRMHCVLN